MPNADHGLMTIFAEALDRPDPAARAAYLDDACGDDAPLRRRVEALLAAHDGAGRFLEPDPGGFVAGQVIGRYTLLEVLGQGGMGAVYRADQTEPVRRQVALKLIKIGMDSRAVLARFDAERQALALMDHPNIARVYDGGATAAGQPFFVMELVSGEPITQFCDRHRLSIRARLELFVAVCQAVQHAHQKGIIHRDLKPGNVLVALIDGRPTPKVIDFGVAKATEFKLTDQSLADTGAIVGTPTYMSPEQADPSSMDIDTRTDVYALGVILYELLAGSPPLEANPFKRGAILEMLRMVREVDPPRPSTKASTAEAPTSIASSRDIEPAQLEQALRGDLDWIVMKALEKDRARRYETASGFATDILRHLVYEPVLAAPPSRAYRLRKLVRKHRGAVIAASLVVLTLMSGVAGTTWGLIQAENRRREANQARAAESERVQERDVAVLVAAARAEELQYRLGVSKMVLAGAAFSDRELVQAAELLDDVPPSQRGWEWRHLKQRTRGGLFTLYGHTGAVTSVAFSPDGARIVSGGDKTAKVWDARTGTLLLDLNAHTGRVTSVSFSPDGARIVTGGGEARVWDARMGTPLFDLNGHTGMVMCVSFSPDGSRILTGSGDGTAKVWDARTGKALVDLKGITGTVWSASFSPDGARIVTGVGRQTAQVWDARTGTALFELKGHSAGRVMSAWFSPDGARLLTSSGDKTANVWDAGTGTALLELKGHTDTVMGASFSPDGGRIVTGGADRTAKVWDARTGTALLELNGHTGAVMSVAFSPDGERIVTGSQDQTVKVWDARTETAVLDLRGHGGEVRSVAFSPDGARIVTGSAGREDETARVWDARSGSALVDMKGPTGGVTCASFSPDGARIVTGGYDWTAKVWNSRTGTVSLVLKGLSRAVESVSFSPDGSRIVTGGEAKVWDARTGTPLLDLDRRMATWASFSPDGARIVTDSHDQTAKVWDSRTGAALLDLNGPTGCVTSASFSPDGTRILTSSRDGTARIWDARTGTALVDLNGHTSWVTSACFSPDGARIVTGGYDQAAKVWDARTGTTLLDLKGHWSRVMSVAFSPDGARIVTGGDDGTAKVWEARPGPDLVVLKGHTNKVMFTTFSSDGSRIVTGGYDRTARVWDARTGKPLLELKGNRDWLTSASFSSDGARIVTGGHDSWAKVWDAQTGTELVVLKGGHPGSVWCVSFSPDGARIATGSVDKTAKVWDARTGTVLLELNGHTRPVSSVWFTPDGGRIVTSSEDQTTKLWDARTGAELIGEPIPPVPRPGPISPDGRWIAHPVGNRVELVPLQPDAEEIAYRQLRTRPNIAGYLQGLGESCKAKDHFAARFYIDRILAMPEPILAAPTAQIDLGDAWCNFGDLLRTQGKPAESLEWYDRAVRTSQPVHDQSPSDDPARQCSRNSHLGRALAYDLLRKFAEADTDWARAVEQSRPGKQPQIRYNRAISRIQAGRIAEAVASMSELNKDERFRDAEWYYYACVCAIASRKSADKKQEYADRAMEMVKKGLMAGVWIPDDIVQEPDLAPIRDRADFKKMIEDLEKKSVTRPAPKSR